MLFLPTPPPLPSPLITSLPSSSSPSPFSLVSSPHLLTPFPLPCYSSIPPLLYILSHPLSPLLLSSPPHPTFLSPLLFHFLLSLSSSTLLLVFYLLPLLCCASSVCLLTSFPLHVFPSPPLICSFADTISSNPFSSSLLPPYICVLSSPNPESSSHLLLFCSFPLSHFLPFMFLSSPSRFFSPPLLSSFPLQ